MLGRKVLFLAALLLCAPPASAQMPSTVAPRAILVDAANNDQALFAGAPDSRALQGSIAKLMTAYVTSWAVKNGFANWNDVVPLTKRDSVQACTCMQSVFNFVANPSPPPPKICQLTSATKPGEQFHLQDLLQVTLNQSTGESTDAIAEFIARKVYHLPPAATQADSDRLMDLFIGLMNKRAKGLHLDDSVWITVHGGDTCDFSTGCDPNCTPASCHPENCPDGSACGGGTSVHDLAKLWHALTTDEPLFLKLIGVRAFALDQADASGSFFNSYGHGYGYYPGLNGDKNGGSGACPSSAGFPASCQIAEVTRAGHPLIGAVLQSFVMAPKNTAQGHGSDDLTAMFRWGYGYVLAPRRVTDTGTQEAVKDHAIACNQGQCFTAMLTQNDTMELMVWNVNLDQGLLHELTAFIPAGGAGAYSGVSSVDVAANQFATVAALVTQGQVVMGDWQLTGGPSQPGFPNVHLTFVGDSGTQGPKATAVRVALMGDLMALTAARYGDGTIHLGSWKINPSPNQGGHAVKLLADATSTYAPNIGASGELAVAVGPDPKHPARDFLAVSVGVTEAASASAQSWRIDGSTGAITYLKGFSLNGARNVSIANNGVGKFGVAFTAGGGAGGNAQVEVFDVDQDGTFTPAMNWTETGGPASATVMAPMGPRAAKSGIEPSKSEPMSTNVFNTTQCGGNFTPATPPSQQSPAAFLSGVSRDNGATLASWDAPIFFNEAPGQIGDYRLADSGDQWGKAKSIRLAPIDTEDPLKNQYVTEQMRGDGTLLLIGWDIGRKVPRPTPTPRPRPSAKPTHCPPCQCPDGFVAGPAACEGSVACEHICRAHGG